MKDFTYSGITGNCISGNHSQCKNSQCLCDCHILNKVMEKHTK